ncbi:hypothetical protein IT570_02890 [Candidatus Sumerlaeota bacterium]|nr:hypothetical protein [Candidatus Sumerlaeota bacterium]
MISFATRLRDNPIVRYYHPFSLRRRRWVGTAIFLLVPVSALLFGMNLLLKASRFGYGPGFLAGLILIPPICFSVYAPRHRDTEQLEELSLTRMSRREITVGFLVPPMLMVVLLEVLIIVPVYLALGPLIGNSAAFFGGFDPRFLVIAALVCAAVVGLTTTIQVWTAHPTSPARMWIEVLLIGFARAFCIVSVAMLVEKGSSYLVAPISLPLGLGAALLMLYFPVRAAAQFCVLRFFRSVDPHAYREVSWLANELKPARKNRDFREFFRKTVRLILHDYRYVVRALVPTMGLILLATVVAYFDPEGVLLNRRALSFYGQPRDLVRRDAAMMACVSPPVVFAAPMIFTLFYLYFGARKNADRALTIMAGGIVPTVVVTMIPTTIFHALLLALMTGAIVAFDGVWPPGETVSLISLSYLFSIIMVMMLLPRPRRWFPMVVMGCIALLAAVVSLQEWSGARLLAPDSSFWSGLGTDVFLPLLCCAILGDVILRRKFLLVRLLALAWVSMVLTAMPLKHARVLHANTILFALGCWSWFVLFGFSLFAQRVHRLELAHLEPMTTNLEQIRRAER